MVVPIALIFLLVIQLAQQAVYATKDIEMYDVAIIGSGPAGLTAGTYTSRACLKTIIIEGDLPGGQLMKTTMVENWPGELSILGPNLMIKMHEIAKHYGCKTIEEAVMCVNGTQRPFILTTNTGKEIQAQAIIIATGAAPKKLHCPGEEQYFGRGIAACATCDAPLYKDLDVIVVGTGNPAAAEVAHLIHYAKKITVIEKSAAITAKDRTKAEIFNHPKVTVICNTIIKEIHGDEEKVTEVIIENQSTKEITQFNVDGIFVATGFSPNTTIFKDLVELEPSGHIVLKKNTATSIDGIFAAGNAADPRYLQAITCAGSGCMAALDAQKFLAGSSWTFNDISRHWCNQENLDVYLALAEKNSGDNSDNGRDNWPICTANSRNCTHWSRSYAFGQ